MSTWSSATPPTSRVSRSISRSIWPDEARGRGTAGTDGRCAMRNTLLLGGALLFAVACATSAPLPKAVPAPAAQAATAPHLSAQAEADELRASLEEAYAHI